MVEHREGTLMNLATFVDGKFVDLVPAIKRGLKKKAKLFTGYSRANAK